MAENEITAAQKQLLGELSEICRRTFLTQAIFERRERILGRRLRLIGYAGMVIPAVIGVITLGVGPKLNMPDWIYPLAGVLLGFQLVVSLLGTFLRWDEQFNQAARSQEGNMAIYREADWTFRQFRGVADLAREVQRLHDREGELMKMDYRQEITEEEKRYGLRYAYFERRQECPICKQVPKSMNPGTCNSCGNFNLARW